MKAELKQYRVQPEAIWDEALLRGGGYDVSEYVVDENWVLVPLWGKNGWNLGKWPYVMIFFRTEGDYFEVAEYIEGDITVYSCPSKEIRYQITNELAFSHWKFQEEEWVDGYDSVDQLPDDLKGPYRRSI